MRKTAALTAMVIFILLSCAAHAREIAPPAREKLSLEDCIAFALSGQADILTGINSLESAKARETAAKSGYYPQVSARRSEERFEAGGQTQFRSSSTLTVTQNIYDGGLREANVAVARASAARSEHDLERARQTISYNVTRNFYSLLRAESLAAVQNEQVGYLQEQVGLVKARVALGDAAEADTLPIEAQLASARYALLSAVNDVETASIQLQSSMGLTPREEFAVLDTAVPDLEMQPLEEYIKNALASRPELKKAGAALDGAAASVRSARIPLRPQPSISGEYGKELMHGEEDSFGVSAGLTFDVFDGGRNKAEYRTARISLSNAEISAAQAEKDVQTEVRQAYLNLSGAKERVAAAETSLKSARNNSDVQEARYKQGLAIPLDLLNAQVQLVTARSNLEQSRYDYYTSIAQLEYATATRGGRQ